MELRKLEEALGWLNRAVDSRPDDANRWSNRGAALHGLGRIIESEISCRKALGNDPHHDDAAWNLSLGLLLRGQLEEGWKQFEKRASARRSILCTPLASSAGTPTSDQRRWAGQSLKGKLIILVREQGLGDQIQFFRYAKELASMGCEVDLLVSKALLRIARQVPGVSQVHTELPPGNRGYNYWAHLMSLPHVLRTSLTSHEPAPCSGDEPGDHSRLRPSSRTLIEIPEQVAPAS